MNPIMKKELKLGSRSIKLPLAVMAYSGVLSAIALGVMQQLITNYEVRGSASFWYYMYDSSSIDFSVLTGLFLGLCIGQAVMIGIIMPVLTAGSIAGERERQTLEILLTAPISSRRIVSGKLFASMTNILMFIAASIPAITITFIYGGIHWIYILVFVVSVMAIAFLCGSIGVWCSALYKKTIVSVIMSMCIELCIVLWPFLFVFIVYMVKYQALLSSGMDSSASVQMGIIPLITLLDPAIGFGEAMGKAVTGTSIVENLFSGGGFGTASDIINALIPFWQWISLILTILMAVGFMELAARRLDLVYRKDKKIRKTKE